MRTTPFLKPLALLAAGVAFARSIARRPAAPPDGAPTPGIDATAVLDAIPAPVGYCDVGLRLRYVNRSFAVLVGADARALIGRRLDASLIPDYTPALAAHLEAAATGVPQHFQHEGRWPGGGTAVHEVRYVPDRSAAGDVVGFYILGFDVSELRRSQHELTVAHQALAVAHAAAQAATSARSAFFADLSHEIRTPLNAILGLTQLQLRDSTEPLATERLEQVQSAGRHLLRLVNDSLDLSTIDAGKLRLANRDFSRDELVSDCFAMIVGEARRKGIELISDTDGLPRRMRGDAVRLSQMVINLLSNAVKFTESGWIRLSASRENDAAEPRLLVRLEVTDTGVGIPVETQRRLFLPYEQAPVDPYRSREGTGLGLALTSRLAQAMGGTVGVESRPGRGSTFWLTVWLDKAVDDEADRDGDPERAVFAGRRILIVDDLAASRQMLVEDARRLGLRADAVAGVAEALEQLERPAVPLPDALVIDRRMPGVDGFDTFRRIRARLGERTPPGLLVADDEAETLHDAAVAAGYALVVSKPLTTAMLELTLTALLSPARGDRSATRRRLRNVDHHETVLRRDHAGQRVLLAEDNPINRDVAREMLRFVGLQVDTAADGQQALQLARGRQHDLLLFDLRMPHLGGLALARILRAEGLDTPIVAMTANAFDDDRAACLAAGMDDHVGKPIDAETLYRIAARWLPLREPGRAPTAPVDAAMPSVPPETWSAIDRLSAVEGLNVANGLRAVGDDPATLLLAVDDFVRVYAEPWPPTDPGALDEPDARAWSDACHSLRGAAATLGADALAQQCQRLESRLDRGDAGDELLPDTTRLREALTALVERLRRAAGG